MSSLQFQIIMKIIAKGAPALADELCSAVATLYEENAALKATLEANKTSENVPENVD